MAVLDWYGRFVLSWRLSNTLDTEFCVAALDDSLSTGRHTKFSPRASQQHLDARRDGRNNLDQLSLFASDVQYSTLGATS